MKNPKLLFALCLLFCGLILSCSKNYNDSATGTATYSSMEDVFSSLSVQPKTVTVDAVAGSTFYGNTGTRYIFPANCFQTATGASVTGNVQISASEYTQKGDMIFSKMLPISNKEPLLSGGEINVSAAQNGQKLYMKPGTVFSAYLPVTAGTLPSALTFFSGQPNTDTTMFKTNWVQIPDTAHTAASIYMVTPDTLGILSDSLRQCNADKFMTPTPIYQTFTVTIQVPGSALSTTNQVYGYTFYDNYKAAWPLGY